MAQVVKAPLPGNSLLHGVRRPGDFLDCYACDSPLPARAAAEVIATFPGWARALLALRNALVRPFGLRHVATRQEVLIGPFPVAAETPGEILLGFDDRHLNFRVSVLSGAGRVHCATWVDPHNIGGRLYLAAVMPFHVLIIRDALRRVLARTPEPTRPLA